MTPTVLAPVEKNERIFSLDVLRGFVLCGILLMNIVGFGLWGAYNDPTVAGGADGWNLRSWEITTMFFEGTMRGLFSLLFGVMTSPLVVTPAKAGAKERGSQSIRTP